MTRHVTLSNGEMLEIAEGEERLMLARCERLVEEYSLGGADPDGFRSLVAMITCDGVLAYAHGGDAPRHLVRGLQDLSPCPESPTSESVIHHLTLSNGEMLTLEEGEERLTLAHWDSEGFRSVIAVFNENGVLGYSHYGLATESLVRGLQECTEIG